MLTISTFNIQNDIKNYQKDKVQTIINYLKKYHIDILNLQEVYSNIYNELHANLQEFYSITGNYRYKLKMLFNRINEANCIITNQKIISSKTYYLPHFPSFLKRIITKVEITYNNDIISIYNTHLDYKYLTTRKRQLQKILTLLKQDSNLIILTGDFNLKINNPLFQDFISELEKLNIFHIDAKTNTYKPSKYHKAIDHIFISQDFKLLNIEVIKDLNISDHYPIIIKIKKKDK